MRLDELPLRKEAVILKVGGQGPLRLRLLDMGLIPGTRLSIQKIAPMGDPMELSLRGYSLTIRRQDAADVEVRPL